MPPTRGPLFSLSRHLVIDTPSPPVAEAAAWSRQYPIPSSPWSALDASARPAYLNLAQGVPSGIPSPAMRRKMAEESKQEQHHGYGPPNAGLLEALARNLNMVYRGRADKGGRGAITTEDICITAGCNMASEFAFRTAAELGANHGVVLPTPFYFNHSMQLLSLSIHPIPLPCSPPSYLPSPQAFTDLLAKHRADPSLPEIRALVLVTPNNPTGAIYPAGLIAQFARICKEAKVALVLDETYRDFLLPEQDGGGDNAVVRPHGLFCDSLEGGDDAWDWRDTIIHLYSFSKSYAIPGHRLGAMVAHPHLISYAPSSGSTTAHPQHNDDEHSSSSATAVPSESLVSPPSPPSPSAPSRRIFGPLSKALDNTLICAPRTDVQAAIAWAIDDPNEVRWRRDVARSLKRREQLLREGFAAKVEAGEKGKGMSPEELGWKVESVGGYYAFVSHPFTTTSGSGAALSSTVVARGLALLYGLGVLPGDFFVPASKDQNEDVGAAESAAIGARHLRFSLANVADEEALRTELPRRLVGLSELWREKGVGWGV